MPLSALFVTPALAQSNKPNIVIIWGDDIGQSNISAYSKGLMGYQTPNIDRVANEGVIFTDYYGEQSCTEGRSSFITGQVGLRTGNTKVGMPGAPLGLQQRDVTIAELLRAQGYATRQFGKNHLGDRDEHLPTNHGCRADLLGPLSDEQSVASRAAPRGFFESALEPLLRVSS
jgi:arylsulfatase A-like enzyme